MIKIIFGGGAWKLFYILGVIKFLQENIKPNRYKDIEFHGASAGSWAACIMALNINYENIYKLWLNNCIRNRKQIKIKNIINTDSSLKETFKLFNINDDNINIIKKHVVIYTANILLKQKSHKNICNKLDLYNILMGSTYMPFFTAKKIPKFKNHILLDGGIRKIPYDTTKDIYISTNYKNTESDVRHINKFLGLLALEIWYRLFITNDLDSNTKLEL